MGDPGPEMITLRITGIRFDSYPQGQIDGINDSYGASACPTGGYSPATATAGDDWLSDPVTVH